MYVKCPRRIPFYFNWTFFIFYLFVFLFEDTKLNLINLQWIFSLYPCFGPVFFSSIKNEMNSANSILQIKTPEKKEQHICYMTIIQRTFWFKFERVQLNTMHVRCSNNECWKINYFLHLVQNICLKTLTDCRFLLEIKLYKHTVSNKWITSEPIKYSFQQQC